MNATITNTNTLNTLRTPYHALGGDTPRVPEWAGHRSVYRSAGRTLYLVETGSLASAQHDLDILVRNGWQVEIDRVASTGEADAACITLSRKAA